MDTIDRPDPNVPARLPAAPRVPAPMTTGSFDLATPGQQAAPQVTTSLLLRGLSRHWWRIGLCWVLLSTPIALLIFMMISPTYDAISLLRVEPGQIDIYGSSTIRNNVGSQENQPYLETQVKLISSDSVLDPALGKPGISNLPMIRSSKDPKTTIREEMKVEIVGKNTFLIQVTLGSTDPVEAAQLVNAVVESYIDQHTRYHQNVNRSLKKNLESERDKLDGQIKDKERELKTLVQKGNVSLVDGSLPARGTNAQDEEQDVAPGARKAPGSVTEAQYQYVASESMRVELELLKAKATLETARKQLTLAEERAGANQAGAEQADERLEQQIRDEFLEDPNLQPLIDDMNATRETLERTRRKVRQPNDPAVVSAQREYDRLYAKWQEIWLKRHDEIAEEIRTGGQDQQPEFWKERVAELEAQLDQITKQRDSLKVMFDGLKVQSTAKNNDQLEAQILTQDLTYLKHLQDTLKQKLAQIEFELSSETYRVTVQDKAAVPRVPSNNKRIKYMAVAPVGVLFLMLGLFLLLEIKAERVGDPESLSARVQSEVYALPPLPTMRALRRQSTEDADEQIEQFIQRLDHLRFGVCGNPADLQKGRCVLITSAVGGEGKTTLAAQLAARCGNAGMSTLLIDADLRRTGLCSLLDIPEGPGLSDALLSDEPPPTELVVPVQGGTFHLLPAGTPVSDTSRVLQNRKLGLLIAQFRQLYDLVIVDSPPVLPVPDALILGRWVDGAVLAVRYDISRFPQVERARRQLDGAGVAVLGTVINGMKNSASYYGRYSYSRRRSPQADTPATL